MSTRGRNDSGSDEEPDDNEMALTEYDKARTSVPAIRGRSIVLNTKVLASSLTCPICLDVLTTTMTAKECLHRFCFDCISTALKGNRECPACRTKIVSMRSMRRDPNFDDLIRQIYPDRKKYDEMIEVVNQESDDALASVAVFAEGPINDNDLPTPPALLDPVGFHLAMLHAMDNDGGRRTPPWLKAGKLEPKKMNKRQKKEYMNAQKTYLQGKARRLKMLIKSKLEKRRREVVAGTEGVETRDVASTSREEPQAKKRRMGEGSSEKVEYALSTGSPAEPGCESIELEVDNEDVPEEEMMDSELLLVDTSRQEPSHPPTQLDPGTPPLPVTRAPFDPRSNDTPPFPEEAEQFEELMPTGKGETWQSAVDNPADPNQEDIPDEEVVYDEEDVLDAVDIDDMLHEMGAVDHEDMVQRDFDFDDQPGCSYANPTKKTADYANKYMTAEIRQYLDELNALGIGDLRDIKALLAGSEQFDAVDAVKWHTQVKDGEERVYYEKGKQPQSRGRVPVTKIFDAKEEAERAGKKITLQDILDDMSSSESERTTSTPCIMELESSVESSMLTLSSPTSEPAEEAVVNPPEGNPAHAEERLNQWVGNATPRTPDRQASPIDRQIDDEEEEEEEVELPDDYEIEIEVKPTSAFFARRCQPPTPAEFKLPRFISVRHDTTIEHISHYLRDRWISEAYPYESAVWAVSTRPPEYFYVFDRNKHSVRCLLLEEPVSTAVALSTRGEHLRLYFDTQRVELTDQSRSFLDKVVPLGDRVRHASLTSSSSTDSTTSTDNTPDTS